MTGTARVCAACLVSVAAALMPTGLRAADARLREVAYDPRAVVTVPVKRGVVVLVVLDPDEVITEVAAGLGGDCAKAESAWCIAAQPGGRHLFVKARSLAEAPNNLAVVTDRRTHSLRFVVLPDEDARQPVYRLIIRAPKPVPTTQELALREAARQLAAPAVPPAPSPQALVADRLRALPPVRNTNYTVAEGKASGDIVPTLVFDDGRFTYLRFPGQRELPAVFQLLGDGSEALVNTRMEEDLLVVDRVARRLMLRAGSAVVGVWNEAFDIDGTPPAGGSTVPGVARVMKDDEPAARAASPVGGPAHE